MAATVQSILCQHFASYAASQGLPLPVYKAAQAMMSCRTAALGGHIQRCPDGHVAHVWYNSCKHRCCPPCAEIQRERWLDNVRERLLSCSHYHAIFTLPSQLHSLWQHNPSLFPSLLFGSVRDTLMELLQDRRSLGALPGLMMNLQTWSRTLTLHPHLHVLITAGGWGEDGWQSTRKNYLLPVKVVKALYRGKLLAALRKALEEEQLCLPRETSAQQLKNLLNKLGRKEWNVRIQDRYDHGHGVALYLARYVRGGPLSAGRLVGADDEGVTFRYRDHRDGKDKIMRLSPEHFLQRLLQHVPEPGTHLIRYYGVYASAHRAVLNACRAAMGQAAVPPRKYVDWQTFCQRQGHPERSRCPVCHKRLIATDFFPPGGLSPPLEKRDAVAA